MIAIDKMTDQEFDELAFDVPGGSEFGLDGLAHFLKVHRTAEGGYTVA